MRPCSSARISGRPSRYTAISEFVVPRSMPTMSSAITQSPPVRSGLADDHLGGAQQFVVPLEAGAHLFHHDAGADASRPALCRPRARCGDRTAARPVSIRTTRRSARMRSSRRSVMPRPSRQLSGSSARCGCASDSNQRARRRGGLLQPGGQPVAQIQQLKQQWPQQRPPAFPSLGLHTHQLLFQRGVARLQRGEDAAELIERLLHQAGFGAHLVAHRGQLDEHREQVRLCACRDPVPPAPPRGCPDSSGTGPAGFP